MAENSNIEWTRHTFNPWIGCTKVGPGCDHCYAEAWDSRGLQQRETRWGPHATRTRISAANWRQPLKWNRQAAAAGERRRVFCASLADVFDNHPSILPQWRADLWKLIEATPNLDWMLLTKRPGNIGNMLPVPFDFDRLYPNVWLGCTVVNQTEADRDIPKLLAVPAAVRFLSMEPLLGRVIIDDMCDGHKFYDPLRGNWWHDSEPPHIECGKPKIDLVIVGDESGRGARPMHPDWARSLRDQCQAAGVAFHFKQWGEWGRAAPKPSGTPGKYAIASAGPHSDFWPQSVIPVDHYPRQISLFGGASVMERVGKKQAGRLLDGRTWDEMPGGGA